MSSLAFTPSVPFLSTRTRTSIPSTSSRCSSSVRMALVSHEKLDAVFGDGDDEIAKYKLVLMIPGKFSRAQRKKSLEQLKKNANFRGFRPGTIPPFILKDVDGFVLQDSISTTISEAVMELGLKPIEGDHGEPVYDSEDVKSRFKVGTDLEFECTIPLEKEDDETDAAGEEIEVEAKQVEAS